ncbi:MAG: TIGR04290 family methyltransferase [Gemmatimonadota bacterium]
MEEAVTEAGRRWTPERVRRRVRELGPWFHDLELGQGIRTAPEHPLGDFLERLWRQVGRYLPEDLRGATVLDIGCNAGYYAHRLYERGAEVLGVDHDERYLEQARFAARVRGYDMEYRLLDVYEIEQLGRRFDYVLFMGVLYHLRYPLYALDKVARLPRRRLIVQSMTRGVPGGLDVPGDSPIEARSLFEHPRYPALYFVEHRYAGDPTNWWIPNESGLTAMLRSAGLRIVAHPFEELWVCEPEAAE